jgi:hypothetical protein
MSEQAQYLYQRGIVYPRPPMALIEDHCVTVDAGPLRFVVESRDLIADNAVLNPDAVANRPADAPVFDDAGPSLHVFDRNGAWEHLRFDCFDKDPHYHYIRQSDQSNLICRLDEIAEGDPLEWTMRVTRRRLPEMLEFVGAGDLADAARAHDDEVLAALDQVETLLARARDILHDRRRAVGAG